MNLKQNKIGDEIGDENEFEDEVKIKQKLT